MSPTDSHDNTGPAELEAREPDPEQLADTGVTAGEGDDGLLADVDLSALVARAVRARVAKEVTAGVGAALSPNVLAAIRERAADQAAQQLDSLSAPVISDDMLPETGEESASVRELGYGSVICWFRDWFRHRYMRAIDGGSGPAAFWVEDWWAHLEAEEVMTALWRAWEHFRWEPTTGMSVWWKDHARPHMTALMSKETTPFDLGAFTKTLGQTPLPHREPPSGQFPDVRGPEAVLAEVLTLISDPSIPEWELRLGNYLPAEDRETALTWLLQTGPIEAATPPHLDVISTTEIDVTITTSTEQFVLNLAYEPSGMWLVVGVRTTSEERNHS